MTANFLHHYQFYLTPLSPIHMGSGESYEPTNYVIEGDTMYLFDPANVVLEPSLKEELLELATAENQVSSLLKIQQFFKRHGHKFRSAAYRKINVADVVMRAYAAKLGQTVSERTVLNNLAIEATINNPQTGEPYIPASSFKGMLRTVWLDKLTPNQPAQVATIINSQEKLNDKQKQLSKFATKHEAETLGSFASDIFRLLKIADFEPQQSVQATVAFAERKPKGIPSRYECIDYAQYRLFKAEGGLQALLLEHNPLIKKPNSIPQQSLLDKFSMVELVKASNAYHLKIFEDDAKAYGLLDKQWVDNIRELLNQLKDSLAKGEVMLVRLGKNAGAENKTMRAAANILNRQKQKFVNTPTTKWLAQQKVGKRKRAYDGWLPFGWALVEINPKEDNPHIRQWCLDHNDEEEARMRQAEQAERQQQAALEAQRLEQERLQKEQEEQARLATLAPADRLVQEVLAMLGSFQFDARKQVEAQNFYQALLEKLQHAAQTLGSEDQKKVAEQLSFKTLSKSREQLFSGKREKEVKGILRQLRGEA